MPKKRRTPQERQKAYQHKDKATYSTRLANTPLFSLSHIDPNHCVTTCNQEDKAAFADTLRKLAQLSWSDITTSGRHQLGFELIPVTQCRCRLPQPFIDTKKYHVFRFHGKKAMGGIRNDNILYIVFLDPTFQVYKH